MKQYHFNPDIHHRRSIRLMGYDYSQAGAYFVTVCSQNRECLFGEVASGEMKLNDKGRMIERWWVKLNHKFKNVKTDTFIVMPNHFHGVILIHNNVVGADPCVCPNSKQGAHTGAPLHQMIQWFKTMTTNEYVKRIQTSGWRPFSGKLWQRNYYEHVIRDENDLLQIRQYIESNPAKWEKDENHPANA